MNSIIRINILAHKFFLVTLVIGLCAVPCFAVNWSASPKRIIGAPAPLMNVRPYTVMTQQPDLSWKTSLMFIPGQDLQFKLAASTNLINTNFLLELCDTRSFQVTSGTQNRTYFLTNAAYGILKFTEGTSLSPFIRVEMNWENDPDPPTGLYADTSAIGQRRCTLHWTRSREFDVVGYNIYMSNQFYPYTLKLNSLPVAMNMFAISNMIIGSTNYFKITSVDSYTNMPNYESPVSSVLKVIAGSNVSVLFYLHKNRIDVQNSLNIGGNVSPLNWNGIPLTYLYNDIWFTKVILPVGTVLQYKYNIDGSGWENAFSTTSGNREIVVTDPDHDGVMSIADTWGMLTLPDPPPASPQKLTAVASNGSVSLQWIRNREPDFAGYRLYRSSIVTDDFKLIASPLSTNYFDNGLVNGRTYYYRLSAVDLASHESPFTTAVEAIPSINPPPAAPQLLSVFAGNAIVRMEWAPNRESDIARYLVWRSHKLSSIYYPVAVVSNTNRWMDLSVTNNITYYYKMNVIDTIGQTNTGFSEIFQATPSTNPLPSQPNGLEISKVSSGTVQISWASNKDGVTVGYRLFYQPQNGIVSAPLSSTTPLNISVTGLSNGITYNIWVEGVNGSGFTGSPSAPIQVVPVPQVSGLNASASGNETGSIDLRWLPGPMAGSLGYPVRYMVKYSTNIIRNISEFASAKLFSARDAVGWNAAEFQKVTGLGTDCPGYYFTVCAFYGADVAMSLSDSVYGVAGQLIPAHSLSTLHKRGETLKLDVSADSLPSDATTAVIRNRTDMVNAAENMLLNSIRTANIKAISGSLASVDTNILYEIYFINAAGERTTAELKSGASVDLSLSYHDYNYNGIIDETEGISDLKPSNLFISSFVPTTSEWSPLIGSSVDSLNRTIVASLPHSMIVSLFGKKAPQGAEELALYPNPAIHPSDTAPLNFTRMPAGSELKIFDLSGTLLMSGLQADDRGIIRWNSRDKNGKFVASGLYFYSVSKNGHEMASGRFAVIR